MVLRKFRVVPHRFGGGWGFGGWGHAYFFNAGFLAMLARSVPASVGCRVCEEKKRACRLVVLRKDSGSFRMGLVVVGALVAGDTPLFNAGFLAES